MARKIYVLEGRKVVNRWVGARQMVKRVAVGTLIGAVGIVMGVVAGWALIDHYMVQSREIESLNIQPSTLTVGDNYGAQVAASVHVLEPKVSDAYLQYGHNDVKTANPQIVGENE